MQINLFDMMTSVLDGRYLEDIQCDTSPIFHQTENEGLNEASWSAPAMLSWQILHDWKAGHYWLHNRLILCAMMEQILNIDGVSLKAIYPLSKSTLLPTCPPVQHLNSVVPELMSILAFLTIVHPKAFPHVQQWVQLTTFLFLKSSSYHVACCRFFLLKIQHSQSV